MRFRDVPDRSGATITGVRVLVVDDHESFRRLAMRLLVEAGFVVVGEAADGAGALREVERVRPDVVLLDVVLPDGSGLAVARQIASSRGAPRVVLISSRGRSDFGDSFAWPPGCRFLPKHEFTASRLEAALRQP
jgi:DNA-binding NarL/FixJ family response regulator